MSNKQLKMHYLREIEDAIANFENPLEGYHPNFVNKLKNLYRKVFIEGRKNKGNFPPTQLKN